MYCFSKFKTMIFDEFILRMRPTTFWRLWLSSLAIVSILIGLSIACGQVLIESFKQQDAQTIGLLLTLTICCLLAGILHLTLEKLCLASVILPPQASESVQAATLQKIDTELWLAKTILDKSKVALHRISSQGIVLYANEQACQDLGYSLDELIGKQVWHFDPDFSYARWQEFWKQLAKTKVCTFESRHVNVNGTIIPVEITANYIYHAGEEYSFAFIQNISSRKQTELELRENTGYLRALIDNIPFWIWLKDPDSRYLAVNQTFAMDLGLTRPEECIGKTDLDFFPLTLARKYQADDREVIVSRQKQSLEEESTDHTGKLRWIETFKAPVMDGNNTIIGSTGFARDISERKQIETNLRLAASVYESQEGMVITDNTTTIIKINPAFTKITGYSSADVIGKKINILKSGKHGKSFYQQMWQKINQDFSWQGEIWNRRKFGDVYPQWLTITAVHDQKHTITHYVATLCDLATRKNIEQQIERLAHYDVLTDLPNRILFMDRFRQAIAKVRRDRGMLALLYLDINQFKAINETYGHDIGDWVLQSVALRLLACVQRETDTVARLGGDEFIVLIPQVFIAAEAIQLAEKFLQSIDKTFAFEMGYLNITASIGIALYPSAGADVFTLLKNADYAMHEAKAEGRNCFRIFTPLKGVGNQTPPR